MAHIIKKSEAEEIYWNHLFFNLQFFIDNCHRTAKDKGFWDKPRPTSELLMLIVSELAEALEADRHGDKENFKEEIADTFIRLVDLCGGLKIDLESEVIKKMRVNEKRPRLHGKKY